MELPDGRKSFKIGLAFWYNAGLWYYPATQPGSHVAVAYSLPRLLRRADKKPKNHIVELYQFSVQRHGLRT